MVFGITGNGSVGKAQHILNAVSPQKAKAPKSQIFYSQNKVVKKSAYEDGKKVVGDLKGYTTKAEQEHASMIIRNNVNSENVLAFLNGYNDNHDSVGYPAGAGIGDLFFEQLRTENNFKDKYKLMANIAKKLQKNLEISGCKAEANKIAEILSRNEFTKSDAKTLDKIVTDAAKYDL